MIETPENPLLLVHVSGYANRGRTITHALRDAKHCYCGAYPYSPPYPASYTDARGARRSLLAQVTCERCKRSLAARGAT